MSACPFCAKFESKPGQSDTRIFAPLNPVTGGHMLVVPREHVADATTSPELTGEVMRLAAAYAKTVGPCNIITSVGAEATQSVFHLHVHVVPRREGDGLALPWSNPAPGLVGKERTE